MIKYLILTTIFSCAGTQVNREKQDIKELSICKNTLQRDIHRQECVR